jgi:hypothetical protein
VIRADHCAETAYGCGHEGHEDHKDHKEFLCICLSELRDLCDLCAAAVGRFAAAVSREDDGDHL